MDKSGDQSSQESGVVEMDNANSVLHKIASLYAEQLMSDICLVVGNNRYPAHRVILCASSEVFQVMLMNPQWAECRESVIELKEEPYCSEVFPQFLKYLYVGQIRVSVQTVMPILSLADKYNIKDLVQLCVDYMMKHIAKAADQGILVSWLHYTIQFSPSHPEVTQAIQKFIKWNLHIVANSTDFIDLDICILILLLQQNDLVLSSEFTLLQYIEIWIKAKKEQLDKDSSLTDEKRLEQIRQIIESVIVHIRFPMMTIDELTNILRKPFVLLHKSFFMDRFTIGMSYHSEVDEHIAELRKMEKNALQFTPRLYTNDTWCLSLTVKNFEEIDKYQGLGACFFSHSNLSETHDDQTVTWDIDFYPRGVKYNRAKGINITSLTAPIEIPEKIMKTIRLRVTCKSDLDSEQKFKIGVLVTGVQNEKEHIRTVHVRTKYFSNIDRVLNIDDVLPYDELKMSSPILSPHLIGHLRNMIIIQVIIIPMDQYTCHDSPPFEFQ